MWTLAEGVALSRMVESYCPKHGFHVALTGGALYKDGSRKDVDLLFYHIRQHRNPDREALLADLTKQGLIVYDRCGWVFKAVYDGNPVDLLFPEEREMWYRPDEKKSSPYGSRRRGFFSWLLGL